MLVIVIDGNSEMIDFFHSLVAQVFDVEGQVISSKEVNVYNHERPNPLVDDFFFTWHSILFSFIMASLLSLGGKMMQGDLAKVLVFTGELG